MTTKKEYPDQVERALARQRAVIAKAATPEAEEFCLGEGGSNFAALASKVRQTMLARERAQGFEMAPQGVTRERAVSLAPKLDQAGNSGTGTDIQR